jgi:hypothetical protein
VPFSRSASARTLRDRSLPGIRHGGSGADLRDAWHAWSFQRALGHHGVMVATGRDRSSTASAFPAVPW